MKKIVTGFTSLDDVKEYLQSVEKYTDWVWCNGKKPTKGIIYRERFIKYQKEGGFTIAYSNNFGYASIKFYGDGEEQIHFKDAILKLKKQSMKTLKTFESNKTITQLGIDTKKKFVVVQQEYPFYEGDVLTLIGDDDSDSPEFRDQGGTFGYIHLDRIAYYEEEMQEGDEVYVSSLSEEVARKIKVKRILLRECSDGYVCVELGYQEDYKEGKAFDTEYWKYAVPVQDEPIKEYTMEQLQEKLGEEFKIIK